MPGRVRVKLEHREVAGDEGQRCRHLTGQSNAGQEAGQTIQQSHQHHDEGIGNETCQHHGAQAVLAQAGADGGIAVHSQGKRQCTGIDLAGHLDHVLLREGLDAELVMMAAPSVMAALTVAVLTF